MKLDVKPIIKNNKDFETIIISVMFPYEKNNKDIAKDCLLSSLVSYMNEYYTTEEEFYKILTKNLVRSSRVSTFNMGLNNFLCYDFVIPSISALGYDNLENQFDLFEKILYHPKVIDEGFDSFELERNKVTLKVSVGNYLNNLRNYQGFKLMNLIDKDEVIFKSIINHKDQIDLVNSKDMYDYYKSIVKQNPIVFVHGNITDEIKFSEYINKYIYKFNNKTINFDENYYYFIHCRDKVNIVNEKKTFKDSSITLLYTIKDYSKDDAVYLQVISSLLTSLSSRLLSKKLRDELEAIYSSSVVSYSRYGLLEITSYISKDKKDIVIDGTKDVLNSLKDIDLVNEKLEKIKLRAKDSLVRRLDNKFALLDDLIAENLKFDKPKDELYEELIKVTAKDIANFIDRLVLDTELFIEEEDHE